MYIVVPATVAVVFRPFLQPPETGDNNKKTKRLSLSPPTRECLLFQSPPTFFDGCRKKEPFFRVDYFLPVPGKNRLVVPVKKDDEYIPPSRLFFFLLWRLFHHRLAY